MKEAEIVKPKVEVEQLPARELQPVAQAPEVILDAAQKAAQALTRVVKQKKNPVVIRGQQYLEYEDWQTLGQFYGYTVKTGEAVRVEINGVSGAKATATLFDALARVVGGAEAYCLSDEGKWGDKPWFMLASMAQTRAGAKALRNRLAWVAVLAGYRPTPAEEMSNGESFETRQARATEAPVKAKPNVSETARKKIILAFAEFGVSQSEIEKKLKKKIEDLDRHDIATLKGYCEALQAGEKKSEEIFGKQESSDDASGVEEAAREAVGAKFEADVKPPTEDDIPF